MARRIYEVGRVILGWVIANFLGVAAIGVLFPIIPFLKSILLDGTYPWMLVYSLIIGIPIGLAQWLALRRVAPISILWVLTISAGLLLGLVVVSSPITAGIWGFSDEESILSLMKAYTTIGLLVGLVQWLFLRGHFAKSLVWLLSSAVGLGLGIGLVLASNLINQPGAISIIIVALVYAIATGLAISWMPVSKTKIESNLVNTT